ncbi:MAG: hypothetical protein JO091_01925 [Acidobacteriaceae bacterium]|nr:hypothetical protein [Acidobacteriaceae bacterium]
MFKTILISMICVGCAFAQNTTIAKGGAVQFSDSVGPVPAEPHNAFYFRVADSMAPVTGAPYSAQSTTERVQVLADGNRIEQTTSANIARDSLGRVRNEMVLGGLPLANGDTPHLVTISDPVTGSHYTLDQNLKIAFKMPALKGPPLGPNVKGGMTINAVSVNGPGMMTVASGPNVKGMMAAAQGQASTTDLGTQTIEGVAAQGTRTTRTIPAGAMGNQSPIVITTENWYSPDLKVLVMSKSSDPRIGDTTYKLTNIQRGEPSPTLFEVPADYTVKEGPEGDQVFVKGPGPKQ